MLLDDLGHDRHVGLGPLDFDADGDDRTYDGPKEARRGRGLSYENCTNASPRRQTWKVCPKGLCVKTMLAAAT